MICGMLLLEPSYTALLGSNFDVFAGTSIVIVDIFGIHSCKSNFDVLQ